MFDISTIMFEKKITLIIVIREIDMIISILSGLKIILQNKCLLLNWIWPSDDRL